MGTQVRAGGAVLCLLLLAVLGAGCQAASGPESQQTKRADRATPTTTVPVTEPAASSATHKPRKRPRHPTPPSITVPPSLRKALENRPILGADVSWPQCPKGMGIPEKPTRGLPMPVDAARFVVLGLTNGPGFTPNPCVADQVAWVRGRGLLAAAYAVVSYPDARTLSEAGRRGPFDASTPLGRLSNVGYQQAAFNVSTLQRAGLATPIIWLDVEPVPLFDWSSDPVSNAAVVRGAARGYTDAGYGIGAYSTQSLWERVVGHLTLGIPEWRSAGQTSRAEALRRCGRGRMFQGGVAVLSQWVESGRDYNVTCPGTSAQIAAWFHQY
jgi:hypothetical protein